MIRGLSYQNGIFYIGYKHIACSEMIAGEIRTHVKPLSVGALLWMLGRILRSIPVIYYLFVLLFIALANRPQWFSDVPVLGGLELPWTLVLLAPTFAHLFFPNRLKKFHGAEHKVFSFQGKISLEHFNQIKQAAITNRYCSTNFVVGQILGFLLLLLAGVSLFWSALGAFAIAIIVQQLQYKIKPLQTFILAVSYPLQRWVTTKEPDDNHINVAIHSYQSLQMAKNEANK